MTGLYEEGSPSSVARPQHAFARVVVVGAIALGLAGCRDRTATTPDAGSFTDVATAAKLGGVEEEEACLAAWLAARGLDRYGSPEGTVYAGGDPLFDERSGLTKGRRTDYVFKRHPDAAHACSHPDGRSP